MYRITELTVLKTKISLHMFIQKGIFRILCTLEWHMKGVNQSGCIT